MPQMLMRVAVTALLILLAMPVSPSVEESEDQAAPEALPSIAKKTQDMERLAGFFDLYWDERTAKLWLRIERFDQPFLYVTALAQGVGSNDIGLDRGQLGSERVVELRRQGAKVLLVQRNLAYRVDGDNAAARDAVQSSFAESVLWGFDVAAASDGAVLVDATDFFLRDAHGVARALKETKQGEYEAAADRSAIHMPRTKAFPDNVEVEAVVTLTGKPTGEQADFIKGVAPDPHAVSVRQRHSLVRLPESGYEPLGFDPRAGYMAGQYGLAYTDFGAGLGESLTRRLTLRHRLERRDRQGERSPPREPLVYYVDRGAPAPVRQALMEGASWWADAFAAAGFEDAFRVELLPEDADPLDVRYNVIQWVHRATRGWSYGGSVIDPRTGEILKGHVTLGSQRVRQDYLLAEGLLAPYDGDGKTDPRMRALALARIRQLAAHEVGHTLGLAHNFAASPDGRASVMDYPAPYVRLREDGTVDMSKAYDTGIGEWDRYAIRWAYTDFGDAADADARREAILREAREAGLRYITDADARSDGAAHPAAHLWDNGSDPVAELERIMHLRREVLARFDEQVIPSGEPLAALEDALVPMYLMHRYQLAAAAKVLGGLDYRYALRGDGGGAPVDRLSPARQRAALEAIVASLAPAALALPEDLLAQLPPRPPGYRLTREHFQRSTGVTFDPLAAAESAAVLAVEQLLDPRRAARLVVQHAHRPDSPGFAGTIDRLLAVSWRHARGSDYHGALRRVVDRVVLHHLMRLSRHDKAAAQVRALATDALVELAGWIDSQLDTGVDERAQRAHLRLARDEIRRFREDPEAEAAFPPAEPPPGSPIGMTSGR